MSTAPFRGAGLLYSIEGSGSRIFRGTCFALMNRHTFLTAAHCIEGLDSRGISIGTPFLKPGESWQATAIVRHSKADIAVIKVDPAGTSYVTPFTEVSLSATFGTEVAAIGYPEDSTWSGVMRPTARYFCGNVQRFMSYRSPLGFEYQAAELSFGSPAGLSGGPVFTKGLINHVVGVVCENFESTTYLRTTEEVQQNGSVYRDKVHSVINYAICARLSDLQNWLNQTIGD